MQPLSDQSRAEFNRIFGSAQAPPEIGKERTFSVSTRLPGGLKSLDKLKMSQMTVALTNSASPETTRKLSQLALLAHAFDKTGPLDAELAFQYWHDISLDTTSNDHASYPTAHGVGPAYQQVGPARTSRALAMVHIAMFETINLLKAEVRRYESYLYDTSNHDDQPKPTVDQTDFDELVVAAAVNEAGYWTLAHLYPGLTAPHGADENRGLCTSDRGLARPFSLDSYFNCFSGLYGDADKAKFERGVRIGRQVAQAIIDKRSMDNSSKRERSIGTDFTLLRTPDEGPPPISQWSSDPVSKALTALGSSWGAVTPFALTRSDEFRSQLPRYSDVSDKYRALLDKGKFAELPSFKAIKMWGCDATYHPLPAPEGLTLDCLNAYRDAMINKADGYLVAKYWAYDGTAGLCAPGRLYNEIIDHILADLDDTTASSHPVPRAPNKLDKLVDRARLYALANAAMADAAIAAWDAKYFFQFPRPVTVIRAEVAQAQGATPSQPDYPPTWFPVGAQISNSDGGVNVTPPFPGYVSGHATFGGALFGILRQFFNPDTEFKFRSDEFNGFNKDALNYVRCGGNDPYKGSQFCAERRLKFDCAERENADSRLIMGVHWVFDADDGINLGNKVAGRAYRRLFRDLADTTAPSQNPVYSADSTATRDTLKCDGVEWPANWSERMDDAKVGDGGAFHPAVVDDVNLGQKQ